MPLGVEVSLGIGHTALDGNPAPPRNGAQQPSFSHFTGACFACVRIIRVPRLLYSQTAAWIKMPFGTKVVIGPGHAVLDGTQLPPKEAPQPHLSAHVYCGQTARWIKMPLGLRG